MKAYTLEDLAALYPYWRKDEKKAMKEVFEWSGTAETEVSACTEFQRTRLQDVICRKEGCGSEAYRIKYRHDCSEVRLICDRCNRERKLPCGMKLMKE